MTHTVMHALRRALRPLRARAPVVLEGLFDSDRERRERYFAGATDGADLERRQRGWERAEPRGWA